MAERNNLVFIETVCKFARAWNEPAAIYRELKARGKPIPTNDMWIAASAIEHHAALYSLDAHFRHIPMLMRV